MQEATWGFARRFNHALKQEFLIQKLHLNDVFLEFVERQEEEEGRTLEKFWTAVGLIKMWTNCFNATDQVGWSSPGFNLIAILVADGNQGFTIQTDQEKLNHWV